MKKLDILFYSMHLSYVSCCLCVQITEFNFPQWLSIDWFSNIQHNKTFCCFQLNVSEQHLFCDTKPKIDVENHQFLSLMIHLPDRRCTSLSWACTANKRIYHLEFFLQSVTTSAMSKIICSQHVRMDSCCFGIPTSSHILSLMTKPPASLTPVDGSVI